MCFSAETSRPRLAPPLLVVTSTGTRGFVIAGSEDGGSVVALRVCSRMVYFHLYTFGKHMCSCLSYRQLAERHTISLRCLAGEELRDLAAVY